MTNKLQFTQAAHQWMDAFAHRSMHDWVRFVKASGLSMPQFGILMRLHHLNECSISDISEHMDISAAAASQLVEKLAQSGLLDRTEDPHDRRTKQLSLTEKGQALIAEGFTSRYAWVDELVVFLSPQEREQTEAALRILTEAVRKLERQKE